MSIRNRRTKYCDPRTPWICKKYCPWFVCSLDDWPTCSCQEDAADLCTSLTWWTLVVQSQQQSRESLQVPNIGKYFPWFVYRRSNVPTNTGRSTTTSQELTLLVRKRSLLRVVVSKVQLPQSDPNLFLLMTLSSQLHPSTIRILGERWKARGLTLSLLPCSKALRAICLGHEVSL